MRVLGIDPGGEKAGACLVVDGKPQWTRLWKCPNRLKGRRKRRDRLQHYQDWVDECVVDGRPELMVVEYASNVHGGYQQAVRAIAHHESASYLVAARHDVPCLTELTATTARDYVVGSKAKARALRFVQRTFPELGDVDDNEADATVLALDGPRASLAG